MNSSEESDMSQYMLDQYKVAVDLYKHEDLLNWQKFNNLIYVNTALVGFVAFFQVGFPKIVATVLPLFGLLVSVCFLVCIRAGITYLQARKEAAIAIEKQIHEKTNLRVVDVDYPILRNSPTTRTLTLFPILFCLPS